MPLRFLICVLALSSCSSPAADVNCLDTAEPGVLVLVQDSATGAALTSTAEAVLVEGTYYERLRIMDHRVPALRGAEERPGTYTLTVGHAGYRAWSRSGIKVWPGTCHVVTVSVTAPLVPLDPPL